MNKANSIAIWAGVGILVAVLGAGAFFALRGGSASFTNAPELDWRVLSEMDYITGKAPETLSALNGKIVRIPGFMVPLEDNQKAVVEFLLVPSPQACIHVPPPPPNQMVLVHMEEGKGTEAAVGPIWIYGELSIGPQRHMYGESSFTMKGLRVEPYQL